MPTNYQVAVLADIHGNQAALEAVLKDIHANSHVDHLIAAGDIIGGPGQEEVVNRLRELGAVMILGNWDHRVLTIEQGTAPPHYYTASQFSLVRWVHKNLSAETLQFLAALPEQTVLNLAGADTVRIVHGSPRHIAEKVFHHPTDRLDEIFAQVSEPVIIFGHTHRQWQVQRNGRLALNPGALSAPMEDVGAQYALLSWDGDTWKGTLKRVSYSVKEVEEDYRKTGFISIGPLPRLFLYTLATGDHIEHEFMEAAQQKKAKAGYKDYPYIPDEIWDELIYEFPIND